MSAFSELHVHNDAHMHDDHERGIGRRDGSGCKGHERALTWPKRWGGPAQEEGGCEHDDGQVVVYWFDMNDDAHRADEHEATLRYLMNPLVAEVVLNMGRRQT